MRYLTAAVLALALSACQQPGTETATLETDDQKASYAIGMNVGQSLLEIESHLDLDALRAGIEDVLAERDPRLTQQEIEQVMTTFMQALQVERDSAMTAQSEANLTEGQAYLAENAAREGVTTTASGLQYEVLEPGEGPRPDTTDQVTVQYRGTLPDGTEFDSSYDNPEPARFSVTGVIPGFSEGLQLMPVGSKYRFVIPADIAYGMNAPPNIGPNRTLIFEVELLSID